LLGNQEITGSLTITQNLTVLGSSSIAYVTASQLTVSASTISVNVFEPAERFGGLVVYDSGSSNATASLFWDSLHNHWVYQNASGSNYSGGMFIAGPRNTGSLGDEPNLITNRIPKSVGGDHIDNSNISDNGTLVTINSNTTITGSLNITGSIAYPDYIDIDTTPPAGLDSTVTGRISWNNSTRDLIIGAGNSVDVHLGQQEWAYVVNAEATSLAKGEIVYISGSQGNTIAVKRARDTGDDLSAGTLGMVGETIASGAEGLVLVNGLMRKLNTVGLTAGSLLFVGSTAGTYTQTPPTPPSHSVRIGYVVKVDNNQGEIYIKVDNGYEIGELHDIIDNTTSTSYGDLLVKSGSIWKNGKQLTGSYGVTGSIDIIG